MKKSIILKSISLQDLLVVTFDYISNDNIKIESLDKFVLNLKEEALSFETLNLRDLLPHDTLKNA